MLLVIVNDDCHTLRQWQVQSRKLGRPFHRRLARRSHHRHSCGNPGHGDGEDDGDGHGDGEDGQGEVKRVKLAMMVLMMTMITTSGSAASMVA